MAFKVGEYVRATVKEVKPYAAFLTFKGFYHGMLHISEISDGYVKDIENYVSEGDEIIVKILQIDERTKFMRTSLKQVPDEFKYSTHQNSYRKIPNIDKEEFKILKNNLEEWIQQAYNKAVKKEN